MAQITQLKELGSKLQILPPTKDSLIKLLKQAATCLSELDQSLPKSVKESMEPLLSAIVKPELLKHQDREVKLLVATSVCEITRITAPEAPYDDEVLKDIFDLIVSTFSGLKDTSGPSFGRRVVILETLARYRSCVVMLDLECDDLVKKMFSTFLSVASDDHPESVLEAMQTIMIVLIEESEEVPDDLLVVLLSALGREKSGVTSAARRIAKSVIEQCAGKLEPDIKQFLISSMTGDSKPLHGQLDYHELIYDIYQCAPQILAGVVPHLTGELLSDNLDTRLKAVKLVGDLFSLPGSAIHEMFQPIFSEFLKRLTDRVHEVRMCVLERAKACLLSNPSRPEAPEILSSLCDRLLDYDENIRKEAVAVVCDVACHDLTSVPVETVKLVAERLRDKSLLVKKYTMERLAEIYKVSCIRKSDSIKADDFDWIPGKILRCFYDKDFRSDTVELILSGSLFPPEFSAKERVKRWIGVFPGLDKVEVKALEKLLEQKQRLQQEMQRYLSLRQQHQESEVVEVQKKVMSCFRIMAWCFTDPAKAEVSFPILDQLKDANVWKILAKLLDPDTTYLQARNYCDDLLKILGEKHRLYDFLDLLSRKCSYMLFNKDQVKDILVEADLHKSGGLIEVTATCMNILVMLASYSPFLLSGIGEDLVHLLEEDNEVIREGILQVLAKAGGTIREQLGVSSSSLDLILERICLEGSRRQAKHAVHALAAITKDDGLKSLSVLYKKLVDMLEEKTHLPSVLQSLGCIAQAAMSIFETREDEVEKFIKENILKSSNKPEDQEKEHWDDKTELCSLKIFGIKTLVKSYLPAKDAQLRLGIESLLKILNDILLFGEISTDIKSSPVDKAHLKLAAAKAVLRLSKYWDNKIPLDLFYLTLRTSEIGFAQAKKQFLNKVHQYVKERLLDPKYAIALLFDINGYEKPDFEEAKHNFSDIIQTCQQLKTRQLSGQSDSSSTTVYPEHLLPYMVHALAHYPSFPNVDECRDVKAFEPVYRQLNLLLSMLLHCGEESTAEDINNKESISSVLSIFHSIKCSNDASDPAKSKNSHALCDLGLSITKRLVKKEDLAEVNTSVSLPEVLYKPREAKEGDDTVVDEGHTWLADDGVISQFESLKLKVNGEIQPEVVEDEGMKDGDLVGNDIPLSLILKRLKAKSSKAKRRAKMETAPNGSKKEDDMDILKVVREIDMDDLEISNKFESTNGHHDDTNETTLDHNLQGKKRRNGTETSPPVPKRRRSSSHGPQKLSLAKNISNGPKKTSTESTPSQPKILSESPERDTEIADGTEDKITSQEKNVKPAKSRLLTTRSKNNSNSSKRKRKTSGKDHNVEVQKDSKLEEFDMTPDKLVESEDTKQFNSPKSSTGSLNKLKKKNINTSGLSKCTTKEGGSETMDLINCSVKIWWPVDKEFYSGIVKSYDPEKKKHVVQYDDGDVEVLNLEKERWELVESAPKIAKRSKPVKGTPREKISSEPKKKSVSSSSEPKKKPTSTSSEPKKAPTSTSSEPKQTPISTSSEPKKKPTTASSESKKKPTSSSSEPKKKPTNASSEPKKKSTSTSLEPKMKSVTSLDQGNLSVDVSPSPKVRGKRTPRKNPRSGQKVASKRKISFKMSRNESDDEMSEDNVKKGASDKDLMEIDGKSSTDVEDSENVSSSDEEAKSRQKKSKKPFVAAPSKKFDADSSSDSEDTESEADEPRKKTGKSAKKAKTDDSEDEPLGVWKSRLGKAAAKRK